MESRKNDFKDGKLRWDLLPLDLVEKVVEVYSFGARKYAPNSWQGLPDGYERYKAAFMRHVVAFEKGEAKDAESGLHHLAHAAWNGLAMLYFGMRKEVNRDERERVSGTGGTFGVSDTTDGTVEVSVNGTKI